MRTSLRGHSPECTCSPVSMDLSAEHILIARVKAGDPRAERLFYETHVTAVYRLALRITRDPDLAQECTQETFIRAFKCLCQFRGDGPVGAWMRKVTLSVVHNVWQKEASWRTHTIALDDVEDLVAPGDLQQFDQYEQLTHALALLSPKHRQMLLLYYGRGYTHQQLAVRLGINVTASKVRLLRARTQLRQLLTLEYDPAQVLHESSPYATEAKVV